MLAACWASDTHHSGSPGQVDQPTSVIQNSLSPAPWLWSALRASTIRTKPHGIVRLVRRAVAAVGVHRDAVEELVQARVGAVEIVDPGVALAVRGAVDRDQELRLRVRLAGARHDRAQQRGEARRLDRPVPVAVGLVVDLEVGRGQRGVELGMGGPEVAARAVAAREGGDDVRVLVHVSRQRARLLQQRQDAQPAPRGVRDTATSLSLVRHRVELLADPADAHRLHAVELERSLRARGPSGWRAGPSGRPAGGSHPGPGGAGGANLRVPGSAAPGTHARPPEPAQARHAAGGAHPVGATQLGAARTRVRARRARREAAAGALQVPLGALVAHAGRDRPRRPCRCAGAGPSLRARRLGPRVAEADQQRDEQRRQRKRPESEHGCRRTEGAWRAFEHGCLGSFGDRAVSERPLALRPRLAAGVPLSRAAQGAGVLTAEPSFQISEACMRNCAKRRLASTHIRPG